MGDVFAQPKYSYKFRPVGSDPFEPENYINNVPSYSFSFEPNYFDPTDPDRCDPERFVGSAPSYSYSSEPTYFDPTDPDRCDPERFVGSVPSYSYSFPERYVCGAPTYYFSEPSCFDPINPKKYLGVVPYNCWIEHDCFDPINPEDCVWDDPSPSQSVDTDDSVLDSELVGDWVEGNDEADKPTDTYGDTVSDGWGSSKGISAIGESSGTAANKWNMKESFSASKAAAWNAPGGKETGARGGAWGYNPNVELSGETGHFARKCSVGADSERYGGHGGGNIGRALCARMP